VKLPRGQLRSADTGPAGGAFSMGRRGKGTDYFVPAPRAFDDAQLETSRERDPFNWAFVVYNSARAVCRHMLTTFCQ
jgi:hypothetical protein